MGSSYRFFFLDIFKYILSQRKYRCRNTQPQETDCSVFIIAMNIPITGRAGPYVLEQGIDIYLSPI